MLTVLEIAHRSVTYSYELVVFEITQSIPRQKAPALNQPKNFYSIGNLFLS